MNKMNHKIIEQLDKHNNVLLYKQELYKYYKNHDKNNKAVYIVSPKKGKTAIEDIVKTLDSTAVTKNETVSKLIDHIKLKIKDTRLDIYVNHFEQLSKRELLYYQELSEIPNVQLIVNFVEDEVFIDKDFLNDFVVLSDEYYENRSGSINITYTLLLVLSFLIFLIFLKIQLSILSIIVNTLWFTFLMYRTFYYITR